MPVGSGQGVIRKQAKSILDRLVRKRVAAPAEPAPGGPPGIALFEAPLPRPRDQLAVIRGIVRRWKQYSAAEIDRTISPHDDMLGGEDAQNHYRRVGVSALEVITEAMLLARRTKFNTILDLPCGGGRVTRHLVKFFPEAKLFVSDLEKPKQAFVASQFAAEAVDIPADFSVPSPHQYDLIFIGSLATHFGEEMFVRLIDYAVAALAPGGILVVTTHGRFFATTTRAQPTVRRAVSEMIDRDFIQTGFSYVELGHDRRRYGMSYGVSISGPAWIMGLLERRPDVSILGFRERGWANLQDVVMVQKQRPPSADATAQ